MRNDPLTSTIVQKSSRAWPVPVWAWIFVGSVVTIFVNAPRIQADVFPPIERQSVSEARWDTTRICWRRTGYKNYVAPIADYDVVMDYPVTVDGKAIWRRRFPEITREDGSPVVTDRLNPVGWSRTVYCTTRTPDMDPSKPVRVRLTIDFKGLWGLYSVPMPTPDIVIPPGAFVSAG